jgi:hypothetical protein
MEEFMKLRHVPTVCVLFLALGTSACLDPRKAILKLFTDQGLTLLQPARDYVAVGGLVVLAKQGRPAYLDSFDKLPAATDRNPVTNFKAILSGQNVDTKTGLDVAFSLAGSLVKLPLGLSAGKQQEVQLDQIDSSGDRLIPTAVATLVKQAATTAAIKQQLAVTKGNRVFMVQEVYRAKSLSVKSTIGANLQVTVGSGTVRDCSTPAPDAAKKGEEADKKGAVAAPKGKDEPQKGQPKAADAAKNAKDADDKGKGAADTVGKAVDKAADKAGDDAGAKPGMAVGICRSGTATLTMKSDQLIPFAVRLVELKQQSDGTVAVQFTGFKLPGSLGGSDTEKITTVIDPANPVLTGLVHIPRKSR